VPLLDKFLGDFFFLVLTAIPKVTLFKLLDPFLMHGKPDQMVSVLQ
jgi:hypothetical protein